MKLPTTKNYFSCSYLAKHSSCRKMFKQNVCIEYANFVLSTNNFCWYQVLPHMVLGVCLYFKLWVQFPGFQLRFVVEFFRHSVDIFDIKLHICGSRSCCQKARLFCLFITTNELKGQRTRCWSVFLLW